MAEVCPYICSNKTDYGYCKTSACINPTHRTPTFTSYDPTTEVEQKILELSNLLAEKDKIIKELSQIRTDIETEPIKHGKRKVVNIRSYHGTLYAPRKHGRWEKKGISIKGIEKEFCSECKTWSYGRNKAYCPNCGAKMDEEEVGHTCSFVTRKSTVTR